MKDALMTVFVLAVAAALLGAVASCYGCRNTEQYSEGQEVHVEEIR